MLNEEIKFPGSVTEFTAHLHSSTTSLERLVSYAETTTWPDGKVTDDELRAIDAMLREFDDLTKRLPALTTTRLQIARAAGRPDDPNSESDLAIRQALQSATMAQEALDQVCDQLPADKWEPLELLARQIAESRRMIAALAAVEAPKPFLDNQ